MIVDSQNKCLILRSGSGHLWAIGSLMGFFLEGKDFQNQRNATTKKPKKIRIPNRYGFLNEIFFKYI